MLNQIEFKSMNPIRDEVSKTKIFSGKVAFGYDAWYEKPKNKRLAELEKKAVIEMMELQKGDTLLDVGCGTGYFSHHFSQNGLRVFGLDISEDMLAIAKNRGNGVLLVLGDAHRLPFPDKTFDITTAITTMEFTQHPGLVLQELFRVCKRIAVLGVLNKSSWLGWKRKLKSGTFFSQATFYSVRSLKNLIQRNLGNVEITTKLPFRAFIAASIKKQ